MQQKILLAAGILALLLGSVAQAQTPEAFWISVINDGVYRVAYEDLAAEASPGQVDSSLLALTHLGEPVPIWITDDDGIFGPGDSFDFVGSHLAGDASFYSDYSRHNAYRLTLHGNPGRRVTTAPAGQRAVQRDASVPATLIKRNHLENDQIMVRFAQRATDPDTEVWFWQRMSFLDAAPFEMPLDTRGLAPGTSRLRVQMRGWSSHRLERGSEQPQHRAQVAINGTQIATGDWDAQDFITIEGDVPPSSLAGSQEPGSQAVLTVTVPSRKVAPVGEGAAGATPSAPAEPEPMIDLSLLNWIELDYPHSGVLSEPQTRLTVAGAGPRRARLTAPSATTLVVYDDRGQRWSTEHQDEDELILEAHIEESDAVLLAVRDGAFLRPDGVAVDRPSSWRSASHRIDYLMVAHPSLIEGTERLAAFHRARGLEVAVVDVQDVYDEFNHGIVHPRAIRDLIANAYENWAPPTLRFVLLVGDSSWDVGRGKGDDANYSDWSYQTREGTREGFLKNGSTPYATGPDDRALIPTGSYKSAQGHAASDNFFVARDPEDYKPFLAIGRFPVVEAAELDAIVDKTIRYVEESGVGPWRRKLLWISNEAEHIQRTTDKLASERQKDGFSAGKVYPLKSEKSNEQHQERLLEAFAEGQLIVHFHGHGGRYIWRTGPTDYKKNRDLFNLDHLDLLEPSARLPVVLSMTCFSAPFDHPLADSIGEKFLRLPDRGAIAVLAASWRNSPATSFSRSLAEELTKPQSIGEAILAAKQSVPRRDMVETYNLLGDPAVIVAAPQGRVEVEVVADETGELHLQAHLPNIESGFTGTALIEWLDADGAVLATDELEVNGTSLATSRSATPEFRSVSVYMWDTERGVDGLGYYDWTPGVARPKADAATETVAGSASH